MSTEQNSQIARRIAEEGLGGGNSMLLDELCAPEPAAQARAVFETLHTAFPDLQVTVVDELAGAQKVALRVRLAGTHHGPLAGPTGTIYPTGRRAEWEGYAIFHLDNGTVVAVEALGDTLGLLQQLGVMPGAEQ